MKKKILIAVDGSHHARYALSYAASLAARDSEYNYSLIHVQPAISQFLLDEARKDVRANEIIRQVTDQNRAKSFEMLTKFKEMLIGQGISQACVDIVSTARKLGLARDIIEYADKNLHDAIVVGRRGLSRIQQFFMGSTSAELVEHSNQISVWVVDGIKSLNRVLVAVDDAETGFRMTDYICRVLVGLTDISLTFYHVPQNISDFNIQPVDAIAAQADAFISESERQFQDIFWPQALERLCKAGFEQGQLQWVTAKETYKKSRMIIQEIEKNHYDTVIIGRRGHGRTYYLGSVVRYIAERLTGRAIWVVA